MRITSSFSALLLLVSLLAGQDPAAPQPPLATWTMGHGTVGEVAAHPGSGIVPGQRLASSSQRPARIEFSPPLVGSLTLSPGTALTLVIETINDARELVIELDAGAVQVDLHDKAAFAGVRLRGAALEVRVTGTLFVVERVKRDADYVALVQGKLKAGLRKEIADALGKGQTFDLESRQGMGASTSGGLDQIASLSNRPQIASRKTGVKEQALGPLEGDGGWDIDLAFALLNDLQNPPGGPGGDDAFLEILTDAIGDALFDDLDRGPGDQVIDRVFTGSPSAPGSGVLGTPPPPPID